MRGRFSISFLFILFGIVQLGIGVAQMISVQTASVEVGATVQVPMALDNAPGGLASFAVTMSLVNGSVADIEDVI